MGLAWYIAAENDVAGLETFFNGKSIAHADEAHLEHLCETLGVRPLMDFFSVDPDETEAQLHAYLDTDDEPLDTPEEEWFAAKDGLLNYRKYLQNWLSINGYSKAWTRIIPAGIWQ